ncbi:hypothetical protein [Vibrio sp. Isolate24]|uniref:hypothetical protein n=1 Tax=Vibrio sp. Isolate24 TaxID=2908534 RepID=UPI001EFCB87F|nr:hypothetical protein [Vibrio sp. Isolate24]MCG9677829.1 hypothetical protein [Vibrio sp. Isolate24]
MRLFLLFLLFPNFLYAETFEFKNGNIEFTSYHGDKFYIYPKENRFIVDNYSDSISKSPDNKYIIVQKTLTNTYVDEDGNESEDKEGYCDIVKLDSGCVIGTYSGEICGANWSKNNKILTSSGEVTIPNHSEQLPPKEMLTDIDYQDIDFSIESYMACYPLTNDNKSSYIEISHKLLNKYNRVSDYNVIDEKLAGKDN